MWCFDKIEMRDFFSHVDSTYKFKNGTCTLIVGENRDNGGNNGAGKSALFEAIALALTNKSLRDLKKESFINREAESCEIKLHMFNNVTKSTLTIIRKFFRGNKSAKVELIENDEVNSTIVSVDEANKRIFEILGISREDLLRYFIISQDNNYTFFTTGDAEKKEVLNRITSANIINPLLDKLSDDKKTKERERSEIDARIAASEAKRGVFVEQLNDLEENDNTKQEIAELDEQIKKFKKRKSEITQEIAEHKKNKSTKEKELEKIDVPDTSSLRTKLKKIKTKIDELEGERKENNRIIRIAEMDLDAQITCPHCKKDFIKDSQLDLSVEETTEVKTTAEQANENLEKRIDKFEKQSENLEKQIDEASDIAEQVERVKRNIRRIESEISDLQDENATLDKKISKRTADISKLREQKRNDVAIKSLKDKIAGCDKEIQKSTEERQAVDEELEMIVYWNYYMGRSGFMTYMANKAVSVLEGTVNSFLRKFKSNLSVNINGFKILRDGSVREKIEVFALENGMNAEAFMSKSGGERGRINLAGVLAIQHLINLSSDGRGLQVLMLDETFSGIDSEGQENIIKILESLGITVLMITQNVSSEFNNENKLMVIKENGVSRFV